MKFHGLVKPECDMNAIVHIAVHTFTYSPKMFLDLKTSLLDPLPSRVKVSIIVMISILTWSETKEWELQRLQLAQYQTPPGP